MTTAWQIVIARCASDEAIQPPLRGDGSAGLLRYARNDGDLSSPPHFIGTGLPRTIT